jgi:hypothetical protein
MPQTATLLLLFSGLMTTHEQRAITHFASRRGFAVIAPAPTPVAPYPRYRPDLVSDLEGRLHEARTLASSLDEERALVVLDTLERELLRSPELPQAAFLLAERHRIAAAVVRARPGSEAQVEELLTRARALEGPRAPAFGAAPDPMLPEQPLAALHFADLTARDRLELDGQAGGPDREVRPGLHHVRVLRAGNLVWAGFVEVPAGGLVPRRELKLGVRKLSACSDEDLVGVDGRGVSPRVEPGITCARWLAVRRAFGRLEVAECAFSSCGTFHPVPSASETRNVLPEWAKPVIAGAGTAGVVLGLLWATGAFSPDSPPGRTTFVYRGPP